MPVLPFFRSLHPRRWQLLLPAALLAICLPASILTSQAVDMSNGLVSVLPLPDGKPPAIDGELGDWDLSAQEPVYISAPTARHMNAAWAFMYDDDAFYVSARVGLPSRPYRNPGNPQDAFWSHDTLQLRLAADPALPYPLDTARDAANDRVAHISLWKNSETGATCLHIAHGTRLDRGADLNPPGSAIALVTDESSATYTVEARIPWSALNVPGGKNPFRPGDKAAGIFETLWTGGDSSRVAAGFRQNPGSFAFLNANTWGQFGFLAKSPGKRLRPTMEQLLARLAASGKHDPDVSINPGVPVTLDIPEDDLKTTVNILGPRGEVLRELTGGRKFPKGKQTITWDGHDNWGHPLAPGEYAWAAYLHRGLRAEFAGSVGTSGNPPYATPDGKGGWGGDHSNPLAVATDASGIYLLWPVSEAGKTIVKIDRAGRVLWRQNPFVGGGFGPFFAIASDGSHVYITRGGAEVFLVRLDAKTGALLTWGNGTEEKEGRGGGEGTGSGGKRQDATGSGPSELSIYKTEPASLPRSLTPVGMEEDPVMRNATGSVRVRQPDSLGLAARAGRVWLSSYTQNTLFVLDAASGKTLDRLACPAPRGIALDRSGVLYATSFPPPLPPDGNGSSNGSGKGQVLRLVPGKRTEAVVTAASGALEAPFGIAVTEDGRIIVSDLGESQQVKIFSASGALEKTLGEKGGRAWQGRYDAAAFLNPSGLAMDTEGALIVAEASPPKVFSRIRLPSGEVSARWFGPGVYWNSTWPMPDDPEHVFYMLNGAIGRGRISGPDTPGVPDASWDPARAGFPHMGNIEHGFPFPQTLRADNGKNYIASDLGAHAIMLLENDDRIRPVATWRSLPNRGKSPPPAPALDIWIDANGDGLVQPAEHSTLRTLADGTPLPEVAGLVGSMHMETNGDLFFATQQNRILKIPAAGFNANGTIRWHTARATLAIPEVLPGARALPTSWRQGILGVRRDSCGNHYTAFNARVPGGGGAFDYPDKKTAEQMMDGMGHTATCNVTKIAKYDAAGKLLWMAGRKATDGERPGEMYHIWNLAGLVNDRYIAGASEWGRIYFYTHDGFYVDALMNNPGELPLSPGPCTFGGETSGACVRFFPRTGEVWAYSTGMAYRVRGLENGVVAGERRLSGVVTLRENHDLHPATPPPAPSDPDALRIYTLPGDQDPLSDKNAWAGIPSKTLRRNGAPLADAWLGLWRGHLHVRIHVTDATPLENGATGLPLAFKGGDTAGIVIGPVRDTAKPGPGDIRLLAAMIGGHPRLVAMKALSPATTADAGRPFDYYTPSGGTAHFDFVGEVPGGRVALEKTTDGYEASFSVPLAFFEFDLVTGKKVRGDIEVRLSGAGARGLQAIGRHYLFTPARPETTMTDDIPTEARLYPGYWGPVEIR
ncbi:MAG: hypothetical protein LBK99_03920 [Opitutaceae bacterium]|jgi:DNA-binding beta-propeller fold protein YncE|nr:hypothetical protein [Opitutaceae bacterium]